MGEEGKHQRKIRNSLREEEEQPGKREGATEIKCCESFKNEGEIDNVNFETDQMR